MIADIMSVEPGSITCQDSVHSSSRCVVDHMPRQRALIKSFVWHRYVPHVIEPSIGVDRLFLALICSAYAEDEVDGEKRVLLRFHPSIAPIKVGIFPLVYLVELGIRVMADRSVYLGT
jgi:glycyl-tRNA synthetase (class II)